jgi:hypothetical protein
MMWASALFLTILTVTLLPSGMAFSESNTLNAGREEVIQKRSGGISIVFPDGCKTPSAPGPVPVPYPNTAKSSNRETGAKKTKIDRNPVVLKPPTFKMSTGDEAGTSARSVKSRQKLKPESDADYFSSPRPLYPRTPHHE